MYAKKKIGVPSRKEGGEEMFFLERILEANLLYLAKLAVYGKNRIRRS